MINITDQAKDRLSKIYKEQSTFVVKLLRGGCAGSYFDLYPAAKISQDMVKMPSNILDIYVPIEYSALVGKGNLTIDYVQEYGEGFMKISFEESECLSCSCKKSFFHEEFSNLDLSYDMNGIVGGYCQPL